MMGSSCSRGRSRARASIARGEDCPVVWRAHLERDLSFGADEGAAGIISRGAGGNALGGACRGVQGGSWALGTTSTLLLNAESK